MSRKVEFKRGDHGRIVEIVGATSGAEILIPFIDDLRPLMERLNNSSKRLEWLTCALIILTVVLIITTLKRIG